MAQNIWLAAGDEGDLEAVKKFIAGGVSVNAQDEFGYSPLHAAISYGHKELAQYLLDNGANVNIQDNDNDTPLFVCETVELAEFLIGAGANPMHKNIEDVTAADNAEEEEWFEVAHYLRDLTNVPHPDKHDGERSMDMNYLLRGSDDDDDDSDKEIEAKFDDSIPSEYQERIQEIMTSKDFDESKRDEELRKVVAEMLSASGPEASVNLRKQLEGMGSV
ncbi:hypothetical protein BGW38_004466 [Lunasporangiospora selenospora]|uniref:Ankyrin repeat-containing protein n=1 Tax=Lunasporangiospora selenospora TaxID=979761 RepID=A0A9P6KGR5_9FUNG|nr:hypothetical protein BGW38_004466 [Lunasporangiospora selenospora]